MLDVYKEALELKKSSGRGGLPEDATKKSKGSAKTIFDLETKGQSDESGEQGSSKQGPKIGLESSVEQLKKAIQKVKEEKKGSKSDP